MSESAVLIRPALLSDVPVLTTLDNLASEGLAERLWADQAAPGEDPRRIGEAWMASEAGPFCYRNASVAEEAGQVTGMVIGYRLGPPPNADQLAGLPPVIQPLAALEALAENHWYLNGLAVLPAYRGRGLGQHLLEHAQSRAAAEKAPAISLIVAGRNHAARRLYDKAGFHKVAAREAVGFGDWQLGGGWLLMTKPLQTGL